MITQDDVSPATLVARMLRPPWRHDLYQALDTLNNTTTLMNAVDRAAAVAEVSATQLRQIIETVVAEGHEELGNGFIDNPSMSEEYLLELCDRGVLTGTLGHRAGPRSLLMRMCEVHRYLESILTLGLEFYRDPAVPPEEFAAFVRRYCDVSGGRLLRALAEIDPDSMLKQTAYEDMLGALSTARDFGWQAAGFHARHLANAASSDADQLARFLDRHADAQVLALLLESRVPDPERSELLEPRLPRTDRCGIPGPGRHLQFGARRVQHMAHHPPERGHPSRGRRTLPEHQPVIRVRSHRQLTAAPQRVLIESLLMQFQPQHHAPSADERLSRRSREHRRLNPLNTRIRRDPGKQSGPDPPSPRRRCHEQAKEPGRGIMLLRPNLRHTTDRPGPTRQPPLHTTLNLNPQSFSQHSGINHPA